MKICSESQNEFITGPEFSSLTSECVQSFCLSPPTPFVHGPVRVRRGASGQLPPGLILMTA